MKNNSLQKFFNPDSVAVIGASADPSKLGHAIIRNLVEGGYIQHGIVYPINPTSKTILGLDVYRSVIEVPAQIDLAVIVIPYPAVPEALIECGQKRIPAAIVISAGFREAGMDGLERELQLVKIASEYNIRLIGPNCLGVIDTNTPLNASFAAGSPPAGPLAFMSQSGALGTAVLDIALSGRFGLSKFVSLGNKADVDETDLLEPWASDINTKAILIYSEGMPNGQEFIRVAQKVTAQKPIIAIKSGVTQSGSRAVSSHTGSLAGTEQAYEAAFKQAGILRANSMEALFDMALAVGYQPPLKGNRIAIITNAGGPGILATDALEKAGLTIASLKIETIKSLEGFLPDAASASNPVDVLGDAKADRYQYALNKVIADENVDGLLVLLTPQAMTEIEKTAEVIGEFSKFCDKPILTCFMGEIKIRPGIDILGRYGIPNYPFPERSAKAFHAMADYHQILNRPPQKFVTYDVDRSSVGQLLVRVKKEGRISIGDAESREILKAYGFNIPKSMLAKSPQEAVEFAKNINYPVVIKIASPDILHKTDVGGVKVGISSENDLIDAYELMVYRANRYLPEAKVWGCLIQEMIPPGGLEILIGMNRDPQFGPLLTFGLGGIYVETLKDVSFRIAPIPLFEAEQMLTEIRSHELLDGVRGNPAIDKSTIIDSIMRVSQLVLDFPDIMELDINPLVVFPEGKGAIALDMRLILAQK